MHNFWIIARHEYRKIALRKGFLIGIVGIPLLMFAVMGVSIWVNVSEQDNRPVGYVDQAGIIVSQSDPESRVEMIPYPDETSARAALESQEIQAFYLLPVGYPERGQPEMHYWSDAPTSGVQNAFRSFVRQNLVAGMPQEVQNRLVEGSSVTVQSMDGRREMSDSNPMGFFLPFIASFLFIFVVMTSASYLLQVVTDEKENRTVEILLTSLSPEQLIGGKAVGLMGVALTQMTVWLVAIAIGLLVAARYYDWAAAIVVPWDLLLVIFLFFIPAYALMAGMMTAIGGSITEQRQGQQIAGLLNMLFLLPLFLIMLIITNPGSPIILFMTFFPTTSFMTISLRWGMDIVPIWQLVISWLVLVSTAVMSVWASARIFRAGMLRYGNRLDLSGMLAALRFNRQVQ
jgi:ABC-2 type transport system permease protein